MKNRERIYSTIFGKTVDRFPVWLKMANPTWQKAQPEPYKNMDTIELLEASGCDLMVSNGINIRQNNPNVTKEVDENSNVKRIVFHTPDGDLIAEHSYDPYTWSWHPTRFPINNAEELKLASWLFAKTSYEVSEKDIKKDAERQKEFKSKDIFTKSGIGPRVRL